MHSPRTYPCQNFGSLMPGYHERLKAGIFREEPGRESRMPGSVGAKPKWQSYSTMIEGAAVRVCIVLINAYDKHSRTVLGQAGRDNARHAPSRCPPTRIRN